MIIIYSKCAQGLKAVMRQCKFVFVIAIFLKICVLWFSPNMTFRLVLLANLSAKTCQSIRTSSFRLNLSSSAGLYQWKII